MQVTLVVKQDEMVRKGLADLGRDAPFATAKALNALANIAQEEIRGGLKNFTLRRKDFILKTIYRRPATDFAKKRHLVAAVRINPASHERRDVLAKHEEGGRKIPGAGGRSVAIPLPQIQPNPMAIVPKRLRPSQLRSDSTVRRITTPKGEFLVRKAKKTKRSGPQTWRTEFLYRLKPSVPLKPRLRFVEIATQTVDRRWVGVASVEISELLGDI